MKEVVIKEENGYFLWEEGFCGNNIGIVWEKEYAELIQKALNFYKENNQILIKKEEC